MFEALQYSLGTKILKFWYLSGMEEKQKAGFGTAQLCCRCLPSSLFGAQILFFLLKWSLNPAVSAVITSVGAARWIRKSELVAEKLRWYVCVFPELVWPWLFELDFYLVPISPITFVDQMKWKSNKLGVLEEVFGGAWHKRTWIAIWYVHRETNSFLSPIFVYKNY